MICLILCCFLLFTLKHNLINSISIFHIEIVTKDTIKMFVKYFSYLTTFAGIIKIELKCCFFCFIIFDDFLIVNTSIRKRNLNNNDVDLMIINVSQSLCRQKLNPLQKHISQFRTMKLRVNE